MKVDNLTIGKVFSTGGDVHYVLPHFQREYTWGKTEWETLWNDTLEVYEEFDPENQPEHFLGSLVVIEAGMTDGVIPVFTLVDGQQRLTTISLLLHALYAHVQTHPEHQQLAKRVRRLLVNDVDLSRDVALKVLPTTKYDDRTAYRSLLTDDGTEHESTPSPSNIQKAYTYLSRELERAIASGKIDVDRLYPVITNCFQVVFINLSHDESPYRIFESLNAKGKELSPADLVRNYIAMRLPARQQEHVFTHDWQRIEERLQEQREVGRIGELTAFIRHYLAMVNGSLCNEKHVYARFRDRMERNEFKSTEAFIAEIATLRRFAMYYDRFLCREREPRDAIRLRLERLGILETSTSYPLLMKLFDAADAHTLSEGNLATALDTIENYFIRRYLVGKTQYVNRMFPALCRDIKNFDDTLPDTLRSMLATRQCPTDQDVRDEVRKRSLYVQSRTFNNKRLCAILERINDQLSAGSDVRTVLRDEPTIEHIMPQTLNDDWRRDLGEDADQINHDLGDTLGNLTLVTQGYNSHLSNRSYAAKMEELARHGLHLNEVYFADPPVHWNAQAIQHRADFLTDQILAIWPSLGASYMKAGPRQPATKPSLLTVRGEGFPVTAWREVVIQAVEYAIRVGQFAAIQHRIPSYLSADVIGGKSGSQWHTLSNRWRVDMHVSSNETRNIVSRIFSALGLSDEEWHIEEVENGNAR